ncbi:MAG: hypothetical protein GX878_01265 [Firmicutes bacterium]|nr:hypothetical protein [Bacillota bacterium]
MNARAQEYLEKNFRRGKSFLAAQEALLQELASTFEGELWDSLRRQSLFSLGEKMALPLEPPLQELLTRQILFTWSLGFAVGSASLRQERRR